MNVLSVGMPRAGSGWHYNLVHDLMRTAGSADARQIREKYHLQGILTDYLQGEALHRGRGG